MPSDGLFNEERRRAIQAMLHRDGRVLVKDLARHFRISQITIRKDLELRRSKHNVGFPSAGSFFKNPAGQAAWRLIDAADLRGRRVGGAQVSGVHSNFLVNCGNATARDFLELSSLVKNAVLSTSGVTLEEEVRIVGAE